MEDSLNFDCVGCILRDMLSKGESARQVQTDPASAIVLAKASNPLREGNPL